jgi:hypothetical protein
MKRLIVLALIFLLPSTVAFASPFLVSDPPAVNNVDYYVIAGDPFAGFSGNIPDQTNGSLRVDLVGIPVGSHNITVAACSTLWGCSATTPFQFTKTLPTAPIGLGLAP